MASRKGHVRQVDNIAGNVAETTNQLEICGEFACASPRDPGDLSRARRNGLLPERLSDRLAVTPTGAPRFRFDPGCAKARFQRVDRAEAEVVGQRYDAIVSTDALQRLLERGCCPFIEDDVKRRH